jgi:hypothetical protein
MDELAKWWLRRRGYCVLERTFIGMVIGHAVAMKEQDRWGVHHRWIVHPHTPGFHVTALNGAMIYSNEQP